MALIELTHWITKITAAVWGFLPLVVLTLFPLLPAHAVPIAVWACLALAWAVAFVVLFWCLYHSLNQAAAITGGGGQSLLAQTVLSVVCSFTFGLPALAIGAPPISILHNLLGLKSDEVVALPDLGPRPEPVKYLVVVDFPKSSRSKSDKTLAAGLSRLFHNQGPIGSSIKVHDPFEIWALAEVPQLLFRGVEGEGFEDRRDLLLRKIDSGAFFSEALTKGDIPKGDILGFLERRCNEHAGQNGLEAIKIIVFSDFAEAENPELAARIESLHRAASVVTNLSIIAFVAGPPAPRGDLLKRLKDALGPETLQEVDLNAYVGKIGAAAQVMMAHQILTRHQPIGLVQLMTQRTTGVSTLRLDVPSSESFDELLFSFTPDEGSAPLRLTIPVARASTPCYLDPGAQGQAACSVKLPRNASQLPITVESRADRARGTLLVALPSQGLVYEIQIDASRLEHPPFFETLVAMLIIVNLVPAGLSVSIMCSPRPARLLRTHGAANQFRFGESLEGTTEPLVREES